MQPDDNKLDISLGQPAENDNSEETTPTFDATSPISAETWKRAEASRIKSRLNTASGISHEKMTADFDHGLIVSPVHTPKDGIYHAVSTLFIGDWFDPKLNGKPGIVHGADFMHMVSKLVEQVSPSEIDHIEEIRFSGVVRNELDIFISTKEGGLNQDVAKPEMTAKVRMKNGQIVEIAAFQRTGHPIEQRSASNTFVQHLCVDPLTKHAAEIKLAQQTEKDFTPPETFEVTLDPLPADQIPAFTKLYAKNPNGITGSTALDIVITGTQVLAALGEEAGGIREQNSLGAGFKNVILPPAHKLITGCKLRLEVQRDNVRRTEKAEFWPIHFTFLDSETNQGIGQGTFNWVNRLEFSSMDREKTNTERLSKAKIELEDLLNWSDELPREFMASPQPDFERHKYRTNWFQGVLSSVLVITDICQDGQLRNDVNNFIERRHAKGTNTRTTREEINEANQLSRRALEKLKNIS